MTATEQIKALKAFARHDLQSLLEEFDRVFPETVSPHMFGNFNAGNYSDLGRDIIHDHIQGPIGTIVAQAGYWEREGNIAQLMQTTAFNIVIDAQQQFEELRADLVSRLEEEYGLVSLSPDQINFIDQNLAQAAHKAAELASDLVYKRK